MTKKKAKKKAARRTRTIAVPAPNQGGSVRERFRAQVRALVQAELRAGDIQDPDSAQNAENARIAELETRLADIERRSRAGFVPGSAEGREGSDEEFNFGRVAHSLLARANGDPNFREYAPAEWEMSDQVAEETRAQATAPDSAGGFLVPGQVFLDQLIPLLRPRLIVQQLGAIDLPATTTPVEIPKEKTGPTTETVAENEAATSSDMAFGMLRLEPHTITSFIKASRRFLSMGAGADQFIRSRMVQELAIESNRLALLGTGVGNEPLGVLNTAGINTVDFSGFTANAAKGSQIYPALLQMEDKLADANALDGSVGWAAANRAVRALRQMTTAATSGEHVDFGRIVFSDGADSNIIGYPYLRSTQLRNSSAVDLIIGDWSKMVMARWGTIALDASNQAGDSTGSAFTQRQTWLIAYMDIDIGVTQPTAFCAATGWDLSSF